MVDVARPVVDSDILIDYLRGGGPGLDLVRQVIRRSGYRVTAVTAFELALGRSYRESPRPVHALLAAPVLMLTRKAALRGGALLADLRRSGAQIDVRDAMQAGICLEADATLVTRNVSHFQRVPGLRLSDPAELT
ncbi:MAG TPA: type II toxin-antitoxin system VapC family toxin [Solirubrobacterales bacterium]|nr:type II toxin-antitoxin system VapC family toxin [Solirubrobacterales bacterium]